MEAHLSKMAEAIESLSVAEQRKMQDLNRPLKRKRLRIRHGKDAQPFTRFRSGNPTGTTPHFRAWMADLNIKRALQGTTLASLADRHDDPKMAVKYGLLRERGIRNVYQLTQTPKADLLRVKGIGPKFLEDVKADLAKHQVSVNW